MVGCLAFDRSWDQRASFGTQKVPLRGIVPTLRGSAALSSWIDSKRDPGRHPIGHFRKTRPRTTCCNWQNPLSREVYRQPATLWLRSRGWLHRLTPRRRGFGSFAMIRRDESGVRVTSPLGPEAASAPSCRTTSSIRRTAWVHGSRWQESKPGDTVRPHPSWPCKVRLTAATTSLGGGRTDGHATALVDGC